VIILPELENRAVLEALNDQVKALGYFTVVELDSTVTDCDRGIDVGVLTRLQLAGSPSTHRIDFGDDRALCGATRDITQVPLELPGGKTLILFAVHFPSGNKAVCRDHAMQKLNALKAALPQDSIAVAGGDFNVPCQESQGDLFARMLAEGRWTVPPEVRKGCGESGSSRYAHWRPGNEKWPTWSFLDFFLVSDNLVAEVPTKAGWFANLGSFRTAVVSPDQTEASSAGLLSPRRMNFDDGSGISDHWPVLIDLVPRQ
jgi:endonuclease/exonuclease/phosphatase family metal-dependent hydrolase